MRPGEGDPFVGGRNEVEVIIGAVILVLPGDLQGRRSHVAKAGLHRFSHSFANPSPTADPPIRLLNSPELERIEFQVLHTKNVFLTTI